MTFLQIALKNILRRPARSVFTIIGLAVAIASAGIISGIVSGVVNGWKSGMKERGGHIVALQKGQVQVLSSAIDESLAESIGRVEGVKSVEGELITLQKLSEENFNLLVGWPRNGFLWNEMLGSSTATIENESDRAEAFVGESLADSMKKEIGDEIEILGDSFTIVGLMKSRAAMNRQSIVVPLSKLQSLINRTDSVTTFNIQVIDPSNRESLLNTKHALSDGFNQLNFFETGELVEKNHIMNLFEILSWSISIVATIISAIFLLNTLTMAIMERTKEIGILLAIGWSPLRIMGLVWIEGLVLSVIGCIGGVLLSSLGLFILGSYTALRAFMEIGSINTLYPWMTIFVFTVSLLGGIYPAYRATRLNISDALRYE